MYIGRDRNNRHRYFGSGTEIKELIKKEGRGNLRKAILEECTDLKHLDEREEYWLEYYDAENNPMFMNRTNKAYGCSRQTELGKQRIRENKSNPPWTEERRKAFIELMTGKPKIWTKTRSDKGVKFSDEHKLALSNGHIGVKRPNSWKRVGMYDLEGELVKIFDSAEQAKIETKLKGIKNAITGRAKTSGGFTWRYEEYVYYDIISNKKKLYDP